MGKASRQKKIRRMHNVGFEKNSDIKSALRQVTWINILVGALFILVSIIFIVQGIEAYKTGTIIPATIKSGPMTGPQSILVGALCSIFGIFLCGYEVYKIKKQNRR